MTRTFAASLIGVTLMAAANSDPALFRPHPYGLSLCYLCAVLVGLAVAVTGRLSHGQTVGTVYHALAISRTA
jgi:hypothetical protein